MLRICTIGFLAALSACASSSGEGMTTDWGSNSFVNAAELGGERWFITCSGSPSACTKRARKICAAGFDVLDIESDSTTTAAGSLRDGFALSSRKEYELMVQCQ